MSEMQQNNEVQTMEEPAAYKQRSSLIGGIIGALLGMLVGAAAWAGMIQWLETISVAGGALLGLMIAYGYDKLRGPKGTIRVVVILVMVIVGVLVGTLAPVVLKGHRFYTDGAYGKNFGISEMEYLRTFLESIFRDNKEFSSAFNKDFGLGLVFALFGSAGFIASTAKKQ